MATIANIEQQIITEYGVVVGFIKNHVYSSVLIALAAGWLIGHFL